MVIKAANKKKEQMKKAVKIEGIEEFCGDGDGDGDGIEKPDFDY